MEESLRGTRIGTNDPSQCKEAVKKTDVTLTIYTTVAPRHLHTHTRGGWGMGRRWRSGEEQMSEVFWGECREEALVTEVYRVGLFLTTLLSALSSLAVSEVYRLF